MPEESGATVVWRKSSRSGGGGNECVEVALGPVQVLIRDSKNIDGGTLQVATGAWSAFVDAVKAGEFDRTA